MRGSFDFESIVSVEFGVCHEKGKVSNHVYVPTGPTVQDTLKSMLEHTRELLESQDEELDEYEPSQKYSTRENLFVDLDDPLVNHVRALYQSENLIANPNILESPQFIPYYFSVFRDGRKRKLLGVKRAAQFKGIVGARNRIVRMFDDTLTLFDESLFRLDTDFDYMVHSGKVWILNPNGFEFTASVDTNLLETAVELSEQLGTQISCLHTPVISEYVSKHKMGARLLRSICQREDLGQTSERLLREKCLESQIELEDVGGKVGPQEGNELDFLKLLDRRFLSTSLIESIEEIYQTPNRRSARTLQR